jgi:hypothetical protein
VIATASALIRRTPGDRAPKLEILEGLPCRVGLLDAPFAYLLSLIPPHAHAAVPCVHRALESPLARATASALSGPHENLLDLSPVGTMTATKIMERMVSIGTGASIMSDHGAVSRLLGLLSQLHLSALLVWPINSGGNRKGVTELVNYICVALNSVFVAAEMAPQDSGRKQAEQALVVCFSCVYVFDCCAHVSNRPMLWWRIL